MDQFISGVLVVIIKQLSVIKIIHKNFYRKLYVSFQLKFHLETAVN